MQRHLARFLVAALALPTLAACGTESHDAAAANTAAAERIIAKETRNARKPNEAKGLEIRRDGHESIFAGTAIGYSATFKGDNLIDLGLEAHWLDGQTMNKSGAKLENLPMAQGRVSISANPGEEAPAMTLTGVPGYENVRLRMHQGSVTIISLTQEKDGFTNLPVIQGYEVSYEGRFAPEGTTAASSDMTISGAVRYHKD